MNHTVICIRRCLSVFLCTALVFSLFATSVYATEETGTIGGKDSDIINILLVGNDRRDESVSRSDCILLCSFHPESKKITMISFLRDLYVRIPGHESNRLNAAYAIGGTELLKCCLQENYSLHIDGCIEADFSQFPQIIDSLGGVSIDLRQDEADSINASVGGDLQKGSHVLNGNQALAYSRIRNLDADGDFSRTERQRKLMASLLHRYQDSDLLTILSAVVDTLPMIATDLSKRQMLQLAAKLFPLLDSPEISSQRIPADGSYRYDTVRGMNILTADPEDIRLQLKDALLPEKVSIS